MTDQLTEIPDDRVVEPFDVQQFWLLLRGKKFYPVTVVRDGVTVFSINSSGAVAVSPDGVLEASNYFVYVGMILFWDSASAPPAGWSICNGSGGTPDLRDRFIVGAGSTYALAATGGAATHTHSHSHTEADHDHTYTTPSEGAANTGAAVDIGDVALELDDAAPAGDKTGHRHVTPAHAHPEGTTELGGPQSTETDATAGSSLPAYYSAYAIRRMT